MWQELVYEQLSAAKASNLFQLEHEFHVTINVGNIPGDLNYIHDLVNKAVNTIQNATYDETMKHTINFSIDYDMHYEYAGLRKVWGLAKECTTPSRCVLLYFHSKNMWNGRSEHTARSVANKLLTTTVVEDFQFIIQQFHLNRNLSTLGFASGCLTPVQYFNFWWARGEYLQTVGEPVKSEDRFWYEYSFLGNSTAPRRENDVFGVCELKYSHMPNFKFPSCTEDDGGSSLYANYCFHAVLKYLPI
eukprot:CAMPEP_0182430908 /NCGR_PEP_ID=MMETSP1167-20130531/44696_1 /TAXON_ID=2988 /ORGANISM="Mallomonas Sp, Strain CCMP3275" /LENGTH=245 /DNA_ID=CAMNT_0024616587 /DNA_START=161 /DNA_END=898 /DNA_ORIENTATION=-